jgi:hypothetical protein
MATPEKDPANCADAVLHQPNPVARECPVLLGFSPSLNDWRAMLDEDGHYVYAVAL